MVKAYLLITLNVRTTDRGATSTIHDKFKSSFLDQITGGISTELLISQDNVLLLNGFANAEDANAFLSTELYNNGILAALKPFLLDNPKNNIYTVV